MSFFTFLLIHLSGSITKQIDLPGQHREHLQRERDPVLPRRPRLQHLKGRSGSVDKVKLIPEVPEVVGGGGVI